MNQRRVWRRACALLASTMAIGCSGDPANELAGELGNGVFKYLCKMPSDAQCDVGEETSELALTSIALGGKFGIGYSGSAGTLRPASEDRLDYDDITKVWEAKQAGWVAVIAIRGSQADDFAHFRVEEPTDLAISRKDTSGQFTGSFGGVSITATIKGTITLRVAPLGSQSEVLAGALGCSWSSNDPTIAEVLGDATNNVVQVEPKQAGTATLQVDLGELTAQTTIEVN